MHYFLSERYSHLNFRWDAPHYLQNFMNEITILLLNRSCRILWTVPDLDIWRNSFRRNESMPQHVNNVQPGRRMWICVLVLKFSLPQCLMHSQPRQVFPSVIMCFGFLFLMSYSILYSNSQLQLPWADCLFVICHRNCYQENTK